MIYIYNLFIYFSFFSFIILDSISQHSVMQFISYPYPAWQEEEEGQQSLECIQANQIFPRKPPILEEDDLQVSGGSRWMMFIRV